MSEHYVEVHVNVDPNDDLTRWWSVVNSERLYGFRRGKLLMDKGLEAPDAFFTWRGDSPIVAEFATRKFITELQRDGVKVLRYKLELTLVDSREADRWGLL